MWHVTKVVSVTLILAITCVAIAQEPTRAELPYLVEYDNSPDLPNGIAFYMTLLTLDHFHTESGGVDSAAWIAQELELSKVDSQSFVSQALTTLHLINADVTTQLTRHSCQFAGAEVSKKNKYAALQQTYDIHTAIYDHYYDQLKAGLDSDTGERLQRWVDEQKLKTGHNEIDFEEADKRTGNDSTETLSMLCRGAN
jgi:hypothetical protein